MTDTDERIVNVADIDPRHRRLRGILHEGLDAFNAVLDKYTLADLMLRPKDFGQRPAA
jgi:Rrf2 family transcriptional regulator, nitric oxide-sensitive transcriptional repressor